MPLSYAEWLTATGKKDNFLARAEYRDAIRAQSENVFERWWKRLTSVGTADDSPYGGSYYLRGDITEAERAFAEAEAAALERYKRAACTEWDVTDPGNEAEAAWWEGLATTDENEYGRLPQHPRPWDDFQAAGADSVSARVLMFQSGLVDRTWDVLFPGIMKPTDLHDKSLIAVQSAVARSQMYLATSGGKPLTNVDAEVQAMFNDPNAGDAFRNTTLIRAWEETLTALATGDAPVTLSEYSRNLTAPTAIANIGLPDTGTLATPSGNPPLPGAERPIVEGVGGLI